jgi:hypothetical protein
MTPYPLIYTPQGVAKPACCPHLAATGCMRGVGPDTTTAEDGTVQGGDGLVWGGTLTQAGGLPWLRTPAGWYILAHGLTPQALRRVVTSPRIVRWHRIKGITGEHRWRIPVLVTQDEDGDPILALDRIMGPAGWQTPDEFGNLVEQLLAVRAGRPLHEDPVARNAACVELALALLALGQWVDRDLIVALGWMSEGFCIDILRAANDLIDALPSLDGDEAA